MHIYCSKYKYTLSLLGSNFVRNELMHTDIRTGKSRSLRAHRTEEPPIDMIRVSHLKQVLIFGRYHTMMRKVYIR